MGVSTAKKKTAAVCGANPAAFQNAERLVAVILVLFVLSVFGSLILVLRGVVL